MRPDQCALMIGLPSSETEFYRSAALGPEGYASHFYGGWAQYDEQVGRALRALCSVAGKSGAVVVQSPQLQVFQTLFGGTYEAVILISHWSGDSIEISGSFLGVDDVVGLVSPDYQGFIDLCICHPIGLARLLERVRLQALTRLSPVPLSPHLWFAYYSALLRVLAEGSHTYLEASEIVIGHFLEYQA